MRRIVIRQFVSGNQGEVRRVAVQKLPTKRVKGYQASFGCVTGPLERVTRVLARLNNAWFDVRTTESGDNEITLASDFVFERGRCDHCGRS